MSYQLNTQSQNSLNSQNLNFGDPRQAQVPTYLQAAYSSHLTSPYQLDLNQLSPSQEGYHNDFYIQAPTSARDQQYQQSLLSNPSQGRISHQQQQLMHAASMTSNSQKSSQNSGGGAMVSSQTMLDEQRKQEILLRLQQEREMRRKAIQDQNGFMHAQTSSVQTAGFGFNQFNPVQVTQQSRGGMTNHSQQLDQQQQNSHRTYLSSENQSIGTSSQQNSRQSLVQKLLNERRMNRSEHQSQQSNYPNSDEEDQIQAEQLQSDRGISEAHQASNQFGGFNPESLYQEEVIQEYSMNDNNSRDRQLNNRSSTQYQEDEEDAKYRDAVDYARSQIERERIKRLELQQQTRHQGSLDEALFGQPEFSARHVRNYSRSQGSSRSRSNHSRHQSAEQLQMLPPGLQQMDRLFAQQSNEKLIQEMNSKPQRLAGKHCFTYESEEDQQFKNAGKSNRKKDSPSEERGFKKLGTQGKLTGDYMKPTVNADLKRQGETTVATIAKTQHVITEAKKKFSEQHTFKPQIKDYPLPVNKELSKEERWKKLTEPKTSEIQKRERIRAQIEIEQTQKTCPFKPQIAPSTTKSGRSSTTGTRGEGYDSLPLQERLMHEADLKKEKREKLKRELDQEAMKDCSFKPHINSKSYSTLAVVNLDKLEERDPIHERVNDLQKQKNEKLQKLRIQNEQEQQEKFTFQPQLNKKSEKIAIIKQTTDQTTSVVDRLYKDASDRIEKQMTNTVYMSDQMNRDYSFHPHISKSSAYMSSNNDMFNGNMKDFYDRQEAFVKRQYEKREEARKKWADEERYAFRPEINATSEVIVESDPMRGGETEEDRIQRLYRKDQKKQEVVREMIEKEVYSQYTFKPEINKVSKTIARVGTTINELAYNPKGRQRKEIIQEQLLTQEFSECTFRPQTTKNRKYQNVSSNYTMSDCSTSEDYSRKLKEKLKEKQERIALERREREYQMLKDCTFKPQILDKDPSTVNSENIQVKGLARHLELHELKKKQGEDKRLREAEVFGLNHKFAPKVDDLDISKITNSKSNQKSNAAPTIPEPFDLTNAGRVDERRKQQLMKELKEKEMSECTFKPNTNEGKNKKIIKDLLSTMEIGNEPDQLRLPFQYQNHTEAERPISNDNKENRYAIHNFSQNNISDYQQHQMMISDGMHQGNYSAYY